MEIAVGPALVYLAALLAAVAGTVHLAGFLPLRSLPRALRRPAGLGALLLFAAGLAALALAALAYPAQRLGWPVGVILAGLAVLGGPLLWQATLQRRFQAAGSLSLLSLGYLAAAAAIVAGGA